MRLGETVAHVRAVPLTVQMHDVRQRELVDQQLELLSVRPSPITSYRMSAPRSRAWVSR